MSCKEFLLMENLSGNRCVTGTGGNIWGHLVQVRGITVRWHELRGMNKGERRHGWQGQSGAAIIFYNTKTSVRGSALPCAFKPTVTALSERPQHVITTGSKNILIIFLSRLCYNRLTDWWYFSTKKMQRQLQCNTATCRSCWAPTSFW